MLGKWPLGTVPLGVLPAPQAGQQHELQIVAGISAQATVQRSAGKLITAGAVVVGLLGNFTIGKVIAPVIDTAATIGKAVSFAVTAGGKAAAAVVKSVGKTFAAAADAAASVATPIIRAVLILASVVSETAMSRAVGKMINATVPAAVAVTKHIARTISVGVKAITEVITTRAFLVVIEAVVGVSASIGTIVRRILFRLGRFLGLGDSATRQHPQRGQITREGRGIGRDDELFD